MRKRGPRGQQGGREGCEGSQELVYWTPGGLYTSGNTCPSSQSMFQGRLPTCPTRAPHLGTPNLPVAPPHPAHLLLQGPSLKRLLDDGFPAGHSQSGLMAPRWPE